MHISQNKLLLCFILLLGIVLRVYNLNTDPAGFFCDEASIGYNAYSILTTGKDEYGIPFPFFFRAFGEYKNPIEIYSTVPSIAFFGLNEFSTRFPSAIYGSLGIVAIYLLSTRLFKYSKYKNYYGLLSALLLAISPWDIQFSRVALEGFMAYVFFTVMGTYFFQRKREKNLFLFLSVISFILAFYSYFPARIFIPLYAGLIFLLDCKFFLEKKRLFLFTITICILGALPMIVALVGPAGLARFEQVSIFKQPPQNEPIVQHIAFNYYTNLSPDFLFFNGDIGMPGAFVTRHSVKGMGELYLWQLPFILISFIFLIIKKEQKILAILLIWIFVYPICSMLTTDESVQATRAIIGVIPWQILTAIGILAVYIWIRQIYVQCIFSVCLALLAIFSLLWYVQQYFVMYPMYSSDFWGWQYGPKDIIQYFAQHEHQYDDLYIAGDFNAPEIFLKFYAPHDCSNCHIGAPDTNYITGRKQLFAVTPDYLTSHPNYIFKRKKIIYYPNKTIAFEIGEIVQ